MFQTNHDQVYRPWEGLVPRRGRFASAELASDGLYRTDHHLAIEQGRAKPGRDPQEVVAAHVRRLEALRRAGIVERVADGLWKVPDDLAEQGWPIGADSV